MELETASLTQLPDEADARRLFEELMKNFEEFKSANDERLDELEKHGRADVLLEEKVDRINNHLTDINVALQRPHLDGDNGEQGHETRAAFTDYVRSGNAAALREADMKAFSRSSTSGGYLVPDVVHAMLDQEIGKASAMRKLANTIVIESGDSLNYVRPVGSFTAKWASESATRTATDDPNFLQKTIALTENYVNVAATQQLLDDTALDLEQWIVSSLAQAFTTAENKAFIVGTGSGQPRGLLSHSTSSTYSSTSANLYSRKTGVAGGLPSSNVPEFLLDFAYGLESHYRTNAAWLMNNATQAELRKIKDADGNYLWLPALGDGSSASLLGSPIYEEANMDNFQSGKKPIAYGDFSRGYAVVTRDKMHFARDPYTARPSVVFYASRRVGGDIVEPAAIRLIQASA